jgi:hypothetical protein
MREDSGGWGCEMPSIRVVVKIPSSIYPELIEDLAKVQLRDRAERLRVLAMLGLRESNANNPTQRVVVPTELAAVDKEGIQQKSNASKLIQRLSDSL